MKTRCPACTTSFRVSPEQLKARAGKVRCGQCGSVFNALDTLLDELVVVNAPADKAGELAPASAKPGETPAAASLRANETEPLVPALRELATSDDAELLAARHEAQDGAAEDWHRPDSAPEHAAETSAGSPPVPTMAPSTPAAGAPANNEEAEASAPIAADTSPAQDHASSFQDQSAFAVPTDAVSDEGRDRDATEGTREPATEPPTEPEPATAPAPAPAAAAAAEPLSAKAADTAESAAATENATLAAPAAAAPSTVPVAAVAADGGVLPRQMTEIPGYSKWSEGAIANTAAAVAVEPPGAPQTAFVLVAAVLALLLAGQAVFHFRSEIAASFPSLQRALITYADLFGAGLPPLRRAEMISIEGSDLQADPARRGQLLLLATLANRAPYAQALPLLELTLTDTHDQAVARKVFTPEQYLPDAASAGAPFAPRSEIALRLAIETRDIAAAGYRLYVFYP